MRLASFLRIAPCLLAIIVDYTGYGLVYPLVTAMFTGKSHAFFPATESTALINFYQGLAYLLYPLGMFLGASFLGDLSDKLGRKKVLSISIAAIGISLLLMSVSIAIKSIALFLIARATSGLLAGSQPIAQAAIADISTVEEKPRNMAFITLTNVIGLIIGPLIAGVFSESWFVKNIGFSAPFFVAALLALGSYLWIHFGFKETFTPKFEGKVKIDFTRPIKIFVEAFQDHKVRLLAIIILFFQLGVAFYYQNSAVFLSTAFNYSSSTIGYFYGYLGLCFTFGILVIYPLCLKYFKPEIVALIGFIGLAIFEIALSFVTIQWLFWVIIFIIAVFNMLAWTPMLSIFSDCVDETRQGWVMGIFSAMIAIGFIVAGFSSNLLTLVSASSVILIGGIFSLIAALLVIVYIVNSRIKNQNAR